MLSDHAKCIKELISLKTGKIYIFTKSANAKTILRYKS